MHKACDTMYWSCSSSTALQITLLKIAFLAALQKKTSCIYNHPRISLRCGKAGISCDGLLLLPTGPDSEAGHSRRVPGSDGKVWGLRSSLG